MRYDYRCERCGFEGELQCPVAERDQQVCPVCGVKLKRLLSRPYFRIPRSFRNTVDDEDLFTPIWQPVRYGVSKRELMKEYDKAIQTLRQPPDWLKQMRDAEERGLEVELIAEDMTESNEKGIQKEKIDEKND